MSAGGFVHNLADGVIFGERDVARCYVHRPPYAPALFEKLLDLTPRRKRALDLGSGPGKIAIELSPHFEEVAAVDPSLTMIEVGELAAAPRSNIVWVCSRAEDVILAERHDVITIGAAIAWMRHDILFERLAQWLEPDGTLAVISGDDVFAAQWKDAWTSFVARWLAKVGRHYDPAGFAASGQSYKSRMQIEGSEDFVYEFRQSIEDFTACQHSRATWAREKMGVEVAAEFDAELDRTLRPFAEDGWLAFKVRSDLTWRKPRPAETGS